jgi:2,4-dienoyl-CoA reductase-like NADH-dependent reductase (Old Yellow Enzyme family)
MGNRLRFVLEVVDAAVVRVGREPSLPVRPPFDMTRY